MDILIIVALVVLGVLFLVVEVLVLPGITLGGVLSVACYGGAIYLSFANIGSMAGAATTVAIIAISAISLFYSLRAKTWNRLALDNKIDSASSEKPQFEVKIGDSGETISRLAPMGRVEINGKHYEAKSTTSYIDEHTAITVVAFENSHVIVKKTV